MCVDLRGRSAKTQCKQVCFGVQPNAPTKCKHTRDIQSLDALEASDSCLQIMCYVLHIVESQGAVDGPKPQSKKKP